MTGNITEVTLEQDVVHLIDGDEGIFIDIPAKRLPALIQLLEYINGMYSGECEVRHAEISI